MRIVSWNINSVRLRMPLLKHLTESARPDIVCLQETKVDDPLFPLADIQALGYEHVIFRGEKGYNGVAILSRVPLEDKHCVRWMDHDSCRHIAATLPDGTELHNMYIPAGGDIPDREQNPYYGFKLDFVDDMRAWFKRERTSHPRMIMVGDFNIAPLEHDVWSHKQLLNVVSHTPPEVERLNGLYADLNWVDAARRFIPDSEKHYTWWSYRNKDWKKSNRGRKLDHIWVTPDLSGALNAYTALTDARDWQQPSDHVPIWVDMR